MGMKQRLTILVSVLLIGGILFGISYGQKASATVPGTNQLVNQDISNNWGNGSATLGVHTISSDGKYVAFSSSASNLVSGDTNGVADVFVRNNATGSITLVDVSDTGVQASAGASTPAISYNGRYVTFMSTNDLVSGKTGGNIYRRDLVTNTTTLVAINSSGVTGTGSNPDINADGRYVTFSTLTNALTGMSQPPAHMYKQVVIKDMVSGTIQRVTSGFGNSDYPSIDCDGHIIAFTSEDALTSDTPYYDTYVNYTYNNYIAVVDGVSNPLTYTHASASFLGGGYIPPQISCNGNFAVVYGNSSIKYNRLDNTQISLSGTGAAISDDGKYIAFLSKSTTLDTTHPSTNRGTLWDVFVLDTKNNTTQLVSFTVLGNMSGLVPSPTGAGNGRITISPDGSTVAYTYATPTAGATTGELISGIDTGMQDVYTSKTGF